VDGKAYRIPVLFFFAAAALYAGTAYATGYFSRWTGLALLAMFAAYIAYTIVHGKKNGLIGAETEETEAEENETKETPLWKSILKLAAGAACIAVGARLLVDNGTVIAESLGVPQSVIALTFVALGTSLPELVTAITALVKGHSALSLGNIVGANLFNLVLVSGIAVTIHPFSILAMENKTIGGTPVSLIVDIPVMLFVMAFMTLPALKREKLTRVQGIVLLCIYAAFCIFQFVY
jgi:cation:H+ antiporter